MSISKLCLGTAQLGQKYGINNTNGQPCMDEAFSILHCAQDSGVQYIDTALNYGRSQEILGEFIRQGQDRREFKCITKLPSNEFLSINSGVCTKVNKLINVLGVNKLFTLLMHDSESLSQWDKIDDLKIVKHLKDQQLIENFGVSIYSKSEFDAALGIDDIDVIQIPFNLFDQRALKYRWFDKARENNKKIMIRSVYLQGLLLMSPEDVKHKLHYAYPYICHFDKLCKVNDLCPKTLALNFVLDNCGDSLLIMGVESRLQLEDNMNLLVKINDNSEDYSILYSQFSDVASNVYLPTEWSSCSRI